MSATSDARWSYRVAVLFFTMDGTFCNDDWLAARLNEGYEIVRVDTLPSSQTNARMRPALVYILRKETHN